MIENLWMMSIQAGLLIVIVLLLRAALQKYPKIYTYGLWALVLLRLLCPVFVESSLSLQPDLRGSGFWQAAGQQSAQLPVQDGKNDAGIGGADNQAPQLMGQPDGGIVPAAGEPGGMPDSSASVLQPEGKMPAFSELWSEGGMAAVFAALQSAGVMAAVLYALRAVYVAGLVLMAGIFLMQYVKIRRCVATAVRETENIYLCERVDSPFVMGLFAPRIYLPYHVPENEKRYILKHERIHIRHRDPWIRVLGLAACCLHWWNPLVWYAVHKMNQDMEMFCDETAMARAPLAERKAYSAALLHFSMRQSGLAVALSFGESNTEKRVKNVLRKKRGSIIVLVLLCVVAAGCTVAFLSVPAAGKDLQNAPAGTVDGNTENGDIKNDGAEGGGTDTQQSSGAQQNKPQSAPEQAAEQYQTVLLGNAPFYSVDVKKELMISQLGEAIIDDSDVTAEARQLAFMDLDGDGTSEVILRVGIGDGIYASEVLCLRNGVVYGYTLPARAFMDLKTDGTFSYSSGAADSGYGTVSFTEDAYQITQITYSESAYDVDNELTVSYYVDNRSVGESDFWAANARQEAKADVGWHDFLEANIRRLAELETIRIPYEPFADADEARYEMTTDFSKTEVENFAREVRSELLNHDWAGLSDKIVYPITIAGTTYQSAQELLAGNPDAALTDDFLEKIRAESCENMFFNWQGIMMGESGQVWIAEVLDDNMEAMGLKIIAINAED